MSLKRKAGSGSATMTISKTSKRSKTKDEWMPKSRAGGHVPPSQQQSTSSNLDAWLDVAENQPISTPAPSGPISASKEITDRGSSFIAHATTVQSVEEAKRFAAYIRESHRGDPATHECSGYRVLAVKKGRSGLDDEQDFEIATGCDDDGERNAGSTILKVLDREKALDSAVVVSRWFGGEMLGPARFSHIENVVVDALRGLQLTEKLAELRTRDDLLMDLCNQLQQTLPMPQAYADMTIDKADRLLLARDKRIGLLQQKLNALDA